MITRLVGFTGNEESPMMKSKGRGTKNAPFLPYGGDVTVLRLVSTQDMNS